MNAAASDQGFDTDVQDAFKGNKGKYNRADISMLLAPVEHYMDGEAIVEAFGATPGHNCLKEVLPRFGQRIKVYKALKKTIADTMNEVIL